MQTHFLAGRVVWAAVNVADGWSHTGSYSICDNVVHTSGLLKLKGGGGAQKEECCGLCEVTASL